MLISEVFGSVKLSTLENPSVGGLLLGSAAFISAFLRAQPRLRYLHISRVDPSEGTWADLVDDMRRELLLGSMGLGPPVRQDGWDLVHGFRWEDLSMSDKVESCVQRSNPTSRRFDGPVHLEGLEYVR